MNKRYTYGDCLPESRVIYKKLKEKGYNPKMVEGWVEVDNNNDILPDLDFLRKFNIKEYKKLKDINYNDYPKILQHTWIEIDNHIIDISKNQFDKFRGIIKRYTKEKYNLDNKVDIGLEICYI